MWIYYENRSLKWPRFNQNFRKLHQNFYVCTFTENFLGNLFHLEVSLEGSKYENNSPSTYFVNTVSRSRFTLYCPQFTAVFPVPLQRWWTCLHQHSQGTRLSFRLLVLFHEARRCRYEQHSGVTEYVRQKCCPPKWGKVISCQELLSCHFSLLISYFVFD